MPLNSRKNNSPLYYSISDVAKMLDLKPYVLRYWETEFRELRPMKKKSGSRAYRKKDIDLLVLIKRLLYTEGYTIAGARKRLKVLLKSGSDQLALELNDDRKKQILREIKQEIRKIADVLREE
jgi:DNA-binding transcriptional MerR regulator